ncbi:LIC_12616 family protein [Zymobacter sp. IVIA_12111.31 C1]|uniref:phage neck terminator protein n=1 Tax=Zymobacter sp. IVIA_12111.31 C1 TaxID=3394854 RepID=UPI0039C0304E
MPTNVTVSLTIDDLMTALRGFLLSATGVSEVIQALGNNVPMPKGECIILSDIGTRGLSTDITEYDGANGTAQHSRSTQWRCQVDIYGERAHDLATIIATLWRSTYGCDDLAQRLPGFQPLYSSEPRQMNFISGEANYEPRYTLDLISNFRPIVTVPQAFAQRLELSTTKADTHE